MKKKTNKPLILKKTKELGSEEELQFVNYNHKEPFYSVKRIKNWYIDKFKTSEAIIINMELINGMHRTFLLKGKHEGFSYKGGHYIFDEELKYYNIDMKNYCYDYHQSITFPIRRKIPTKEIRDIMMNGNLTEVEYAANPSTLENFMVAKVAEGIMRGQQIDEFLKQNRLIWIITMVAAVLMLALFVWKTGMLNQINIPGL